MSIPARRNRCIIIQRKRLRDLIRDGERHFRGNGPWRYKLSHIYDEPEVRAEVERLAAQRSRDIAVYESYVDRFSAA